jgi:hypothetical protein
VLDRCDQELFQMTLGKIGEPYCYPDSFIQLLRYMGAYFHLPYRQTQGVVIAHAVNTSKYQTHHIIVYWSHGTPLLASVCCGLDGGDSSLSCLISSGVGCVTLSNLALTNPLGVATYTELPS